MPLQHLSVLPLGPTDPCSTAVHMEPFSSLVLKGLTWVFATTTKICTSGGSRQTYVRHLLRHHRVLLTRWRIFRKIPPTVGYKSEASASSIFRANRFGWWVVTHSLAVKIPTSMATVQLSKSINTFHGISWASAFDTLTLRLVHPTAPVLLTKNGPLGALIRNLA